MATKNIILAELHTNQRAILIPVTHRDSYRVDEQWEALKWEHNKPVDAVNHFGEHVIEKGDILVIRNPDGRILAYVYVDVIRMVNLKSLTQTDYTLLGYPDRQTFMEHEGSDFGSTAWLIEIAHVTPLNGYHPVL